MTKAMEAAADAIECAFSEDMEAPAMVLAGRAVRAYLAQREAEGFVMVPVEPTQGMIDAGWDHAGFQAIQGYRAMLSARPQIGEG